MFFPNTASPDVMGTTSAPARNLYSLRGQVGFVSVQGSDYISPFDQTTGRFLDMDTTSQLNHLNSVPDIPVPGPSGVTVSIEAGNENQELYVGGGNDLFIFDATTSAGIDLDGNPSNGIQGASLGSPVKQVGLDEFDGRWAVVLHGTSDIGIVDVRTASPERFKAFPAVTSVAGEARDLVVGSRGADIAIYVTTSCIDCVIPAPVQCVFPPSGGGGGGGGGGGTITPLPPGGGGGSSATSGGNGGLGGIAPTGAGGGGGMAMASGGPLRKVGLSVRLLRPNFVTGGGLNPADPWTVLCGTDFELSSVALPVGETSFSQVGLDLNTDRTEIFIASPDTNGLVIIDTATNELVTSAGSPLLIPTGPLPVDVEILNVQDSSGTQLDLAYVANRGDDTMSIVDVAGRTGAALARDLVGDFPGLPAPPQVEFLAGSEASGRLFLVSPSTQRLLRYKLKPNGDLPVAQGSVLVGPSPGRVVLQVATP